MENTELTKALRCGGHNMIFHYCDKEDCQYCQYSYHENLRRCNVQELGIDAADALEAADKRIEKLEKQMPKWVRVEDRLPEESGEYTVYIQMGTGVEVPDFFGSNDLSYVTSIYFRKEQNIWLDEYDESYNADLSLVDTVNAYHVTHWMPLPQKPKGEQDD